MSESVNFPRLLSKEQVAVMLGVSGPTVANYAKAGKIPSIKIGKFMRFREEDIEYYRSGSPEKAVSKNSY
jgi:excisionase family DNA binding protein